MPAKKAQGIKTLIGHSVALQDATEGLEGDFYGPYTLLDVDVDAKLILLQKGEDKVWINYLNIAGIKEVVNDPS